MSRLITFIVPPDIIQIFVIGEAQDGKYVVGRDLSANYWFVEMVGEAEARIIAGPVSAKAAIDAAWDALCGRSRGSITAETNILALGVLALKHQTMEGDRCLAPAA